MGSVVVVDSGTTNTRVRLVRDGAVVRTLSRQAGARDTATDGHNSRIREALASMIGLLASEEADLGSVLLSGMITSNVGLLEVPHLLAPAGIDDLARGVVRHDFPDLSDLPFRFIRGVKTLPPDGDLPELDVLRGEEVEVVGLRALFGLEREAIFVHYGSHHKAIELAADGTILGSRTALTGELLAALREHTILGGSVVAVDEAGLEEDAWREGMDAARTHGVGRALFLVRVGEQIGGRSKAAMTSYLLGVLTSLDVPLLRLRPQDGRAVVLYGRGPFRAIMRQYLSDEYGIDALVVDEATAEEAAVDGALRILARARALGAVA